MDVGSTFAAQAHEVRQRIAAAPVAKWLKEEALADLERLIETAAVDLKKTHEQYLHRESEDAPVEAKSEGRASYPLPSDFELRMIAVQNSGGHLSAVQHIYKFLKGETA